MKKRLLFILLCSSLSAYALPKYEMRTVSNTDWKEVNDYFHRAQFDRTKLGWELHSHTMFQYVETQYLDYWVLNLIWVCEDGSCQTPK